MKQVGQIHTPMSEVELLERVAKVKHVALDMDGTIYMGKTLFPFTNPFLNGLRELGIGYSFLTNNPSKSIDDYLAKLGAMGIDAHREEMYTTALATIDYLHTNFPKVKRLFILGTPSMISEFEAAGYVSTTDSAVDEPEAVVVGFDMSLIYDRLCRAAWWISCGKLYVATNPDLVCPTDQPVVLVDCGSICKSLESATGRKPDKVLGKPDPTMLSGIINKYGLKPEQIAMVGDRIYTDIEMARNAGALGVLVLSGETQLKTALASEHQPDITLTNLEYLGQLIAKVHR